MRYLGGLVEHSRYTGRTMLTVLLTLWLQAFDVTVHAGGTDVAVRCMGTPSNANAAEQPMLEALTRYETSRNDASAIDYEENLAAARFTPPSPELLAIRAAVRNRPEEATRLIKARQGMINRDEFFNPQNLQRLLGARSATI